MASDPITSSALSLPADQPYPDQYLSTIPNPNSSAASNLNPVLEAALGSSSWYYRYWMVYMMPLVIVLGLVNNAISLLVFRSARLQLACRLKRYYEAIAVRPSHIPCPLQSCFLLRLEYPFFILLVDNEIENRAYS